MLFSAFSVSKNRVVQASISVTSFPRWLLSSWARPSILRRSFESDQGYSIMKPKPFEFQEPIHILGAGSIGLLWAASIRSAFPSYPVQLLLRQHHQHRVDPSFSHMKQQQCITEQSDSDSTRGAIRGNVTICLRQANTAKDNETRDNGISKKQPKLFTRPRMIPVPAVILPEFDSSNSSDNASSHTNYDRRPFRNLLLTTKAFQAVDALTSVLHRINENTHIIILCNGALAVRQVVKELLEQQIENRCLPTIHLGLTTHGAYREMEIDYQKESDDGLFHLVHAGKGRTLLEKYPDMAKLWDMAGLNCQSSICLEQDLWYKLASNCVINPLTALHKCNNGDLLQKSTTVSSVLYSFDQIADEILKEVSAVAKALHNGDEKYAVSKLRAYVQSVIDETQHNKSSMLQDVLAQRQTEIDFLNGYVVQQGLAKRLACPVNKTLVELIHATRLKKP